jgi:hypothetical protein
MRDKVSQREENAERTILDNSEGREPMLDYIRGRKRQTDTSLVARCQGQTVLERGRCLVVFFRGALAASVLSIAKRKMPKAQAQGTAAETEFETRIDGVRIRFASKLADKIQQTTAALARMAENGSEAAAAVENAYRRFHDISGIAPTIGFEATGQSAPSCDAILAGPYRSQRGLSTAELVQLTESLEARRVAARRLKYSQ